MDYIRAMEGIHTSKKHFLPYIQKHTSIVRFTARSLNSGDRIHNIHKELKLKKKQTGKNFVNNVSLPKQILFQHLSDILNDINLNADDSGDLSLFEQYRQSGLVAIVINGEIVVKKRRHWKVKLRASHNFFEPIKRKNQIPESTFVEDEIAPKVFIQVGQNTGKYICRR
jgi:hypothetical protein